METVLTIYHRVKKVISNNKYWFNNKINFKRGYFHLDKTSRLEARKNARIVFNGIYSIGKYCCILAEHASLEIGNNVFIGDLSIIRATKGDITIGNDCMLSQNVKLISTNHEFKAKNKLIREQDIILNKKGINIGNDCWIGTGACILPGVSLGNGCVVGANSVVTKDFSDYSVVAGNPAKLIKFRE